METAISYLSVMPLSKKQRETFVKKVKDEILSGYENPLKIEIILKGIEETIKAIRSDADIREYVLQELAKHGKSTTIYGAELTKSDRKTWNYNDTEINSITAEIEGLKAKLKDREKFLQSIPEGGIIDPETGEILYRPGYTTTEVLTIKIK